MKESVSRKRVDVDRLSELPESLIHHILSLLPTTDVVSTSLLSKRWVDLWTNIPCLHFTDRRDYQRFRTLVNGALIFWKGTKLRKFTIVVYHTDDESFAGDMDVWVRFAVQNKVEELNIRMVFKVEDTYRPPRCLYSCSSIRKLSLGGCNIQIHGSVAWNQLKSFEFNGIYISESTVNQILLGTPQLEVFDLSFIGSEENLNIRSTSLKKLKIYKYLNEEKPSLDTVLGICCPNLETLEISGFFYTKCLLTNVSSVTDATLGFNDPNKYYDRYDVRWMELVGETMKYMLSTLQHVERLTLTTESVEMIGELQQEKGFFSPVPNVVFLKVVIKYDFYYMVNLLEIFPNLNILVIEDYNQSFGQTTSLEFETNVPTSFLLQLKVVVIMSCSFKSPVFGFIKFLLKHGSMLEKLIIWAQPHVSRDPARLFEVTETLLRMPRSSPTAEVILKK